MQKKHVRTLTLDLYLPEDQQYDLNLVDYIAATIKQQYPDSSYTLLSKTADIEIDTYFICGEASEWDALYEDRPSNTVSTTITFPKGEFCLTAAIDKVKSEFRYLKFKPTCISKL